MLLVNKRSYWCPECGYIHVLYSQKNKNKNNKNKRSKNGSN